MSAKTLDEFGLFKSEKEEAKLSPRLPEEATERSLVSVPAPEAAKELSDSYLISATYNSQKRAALLKLYEPKTKTLHFWYDNTGHQPYLLTNLSADELKKISRVISHPGLDHFELVKKYDPLNDQEITLTKVVVKDPLAVGGRVNSLREVIPSERSDAKVWEADIKYYECLMYDRVLTPGMLYKTVNGQLVQADFKPPYETRKMASLLFEDEPPEMREIVENWINLLECPLPEFRRVAVDIEVGTDIPTRVPDPHKAEYPIIAVSFVGSDDMKRILLLKPRPKPIPEVGDGSDKLALPPEYYSNEKELIIKVYEILRDYPFVITFNGDDFDLRYLRHRGENLGLMEDQNPIDLGKEFALMKTGIHIDLYKFFFNRSIQTYAFGQKYRDITLDDIGISLLGVGKIFSEKPISELAYTELAKYCLRDAELTYQLTAFNDNLVMKLIMIITRIAKMPMEDVTRTGISQWIRSLMNFEHRRRNWLIPRPEDLLELKGMTATKAIIKGKKYKGAIVVSPEPGVHFNVAVLDFASLYPSVIKSFNLSYETILCRHEECRSNKIPDTPHWVCTKRRGISSLLIGSLRDLRVKWYKVKAKDKQLSPELRNLYNVIQLVLKVFLNAAYGVFAAEHFSLFCPPLAESTAAVGRFAITQTIQKAQSLKIPVLYGDTDSVFLENPSKEQIESLVSWSEQNLGMELDVDKVYRYSAFSTRKKNYLGVYPDGSVDIKGLTGKKRNTPEFLKKAFSDMVDILSGVKSPEEFEKARGEIKEIVKTCYLKLKRREYTLNDLAFTIVLGKGVDEYRETTPQHVKAAKLLPEEKVQGLGRGDVIRFVKVIGKEGVKPVELASLNDIDVDKYMEYVETTFEQVLDALGLDFREILGLTRLEYFMADLNEKT